MTPTQKATEEGYKHGSRMERWYLGAALLLLMIEIAWMGIKG